MANGEEFQRELASLLNRHSIDTALNATDFHLAEFIARQLEGIQHFQTESVNFRPTPGVFSVANTTVNGADAVCFICGMSVPSDVTDQHTEWHKTIARATQEMMDRLEALENNG